MRSSAPSGAGYTTSRDHGFRDGGESAASLHPFVSAHVEPGATVITDAWQGYHGIESLGYERDRRS